MGHYYLDSSALVKRYVAETGTDWMNWLCAVSAGHILYTVRISAVEIVAALSRRARAGTLAVADAQAAVSKFRADLRGHYYVVEVTEPLVEAAMTLAEKHALRGYDAVQLAAALELQATRASLSLSAINFVCADDELNRAATSEGLPAENPNTPS